MIGRYIEEGRKLLLERGHSIDVVRGAETGSAYRLNREYIDSIELEMRVFDAPEHPDTALSFFGQSFSTPVMAGALSGLDGIRPDGMAVLASGIREAGACMWAGIGSDEELDSIVASGAPTVKIIKPYKNPDLIFEKLAYAEKAGCLAVGMDVSFFFGSQRGDVVVSRDMMSPKTASEMRGFVEASGLPFVVKGVLSERDAAKALEIGAGAIVVSSHSSNVLDYAVPPLRMLPGIAKLVNGQIPVLIDGDIKSGTDVFKALALGADAVLVGRALLGGLEMDGAAGVTKIVNGINEELRRTMCLTGCRNLGEIDPGILWMKKDL